MITYCQQTTNLLYIRAVMHAGWTKKAVVKTGLRLCRYFDYMLAGSENTVSL